MSRVVAVMMLVASMAWAAPAGLHSMTLGRGPTLVVIHNLGGSRAGWMPTVRKLISSYRVVLVDLPGHGDSPMPDPFTLEAGAAQLDQVLAAQKAESTIVVGQGLGALMAMLALEAHPERARGLVAIEMSLKRQFAVGEQQRAGVLSFIDSNYDAFLKRMFIGLGRDSAQNVALHAQAAQVPQAAMKAYIREMMSFDPSAKAKTIKTPILMVVTDRIWGASQDSSSFVEMMGYGVLPSFTLRHLSDCGMLVASEQPDSLAALITGFSRQALSAR